MTSKLKFFTPFYILILIFMFLLISSGNVAAQAYSANWTTAVTYQNVGDSPATLVVNFYQENGTTAMSFDPLNGSQLAAGAARSFWIGNVNNVPNGFNGNAVISSDQPLVSTVVQYSQQPNFKMRLLYNGFQSTDASDQYLVATTLLNKFSRTTVFSIQNTENETVEATLYFYDADNNGALASTITHAIPANSSKFIDMGQSNDTGLSGNTFNGSAIVIAEKQSNGTPANIVAAANEYYTNSNIAASFEGIPISRASNEVFMATGVCERFGLDTFYAVSNAETSGNATITVTYRDTNGSTVATDGPYTIGPGQKRSIRTCNPSNGTNMSNFTGSASISSTGNKIVVIGKAQNSINAPSANTTDLFTAFLGEPQGVSKQSLSFVRWANDSQFNAPSNNGGRQRTFIAVQNLENTQIAVNAKYYDKDGNLVATHALTIPALSKQNTNASLAGALGSTGMVSGAFGYYTDNTSGGAVVLEAANSNPSAKFIAVARTQNPGAGEDVNSVPTP